MKTISSNLVIILVIVNGLPSYGRHISVYEPEEFIIGGRDARPGEAPWMVSLQDHDQNGYHHDCGGALIGPRTVLTAGHCCVYNVENNQSMINNYIVRYGSLNKTSLPIFNHITERIVQPGWDQKTLGHDLCVLHLNNTVTETEAIKIIELVEEAPKPGVLANFTGWGMQSEGVWPQLLKYTALTIISNEQCKKEWNKIHQESSVTEDKICGYDKHSDVCIMDSGSPLTVDGKLVGVASIGGTGCNSDNNVTDHAPDGFVNVACYKEWIKANIV